MDKNKFIERIAEALIQTQLDDLKDKIRQETGFIIEIKCNVIGQDVGNRNKSCEENTRSSLNKSYDEVMSEFISLLNKNGNNGKND